MKIVLLIGLLISLNAQAEEKPHCILKLNAGYHVGELISKVDVSYGNESECKIWPGECVAYFEPKASCDKENVDMIKQFLKEKKIKQ